MGIFMRPVILHELGSGRVSMEGRHDNPDFDNPSYVELNMFLSKYHIGLWCLNNDDKHRDTKLILKLEGGVKFIGAKNFKKYSPVYRSLNKGEKWQVEPTDLLFRNLNYIFDECPNVRDELFDIKTGKNYKGDFTDEIWTLKQSSKYRQEDYDDFTIYEISNIINDMIKENSDIMLGSGKEGLYCRCWQIWLMCKCGFNEWISY